LLRAAAGAALAPALALTGGIGAAGGAFAQAARRPAPPRTIAWEELMPKDWDPLASVPELRSGELALLSDTDPRAMALLERLRKVWDEAPVNEALAGQRVRLPGYIVPLEDAVQGLREFLLVPYFGACIHTPPPPANQIVHVLPAKPARFRSMDTVWVAGPLARVRTASAMGTSGWRMAAESVEPYAPQPAPVR
jgi:hypothetical protein